MSSVRSARAAPPQCLPARAQRSGAASRAPVAQATSRTATCRSRCRWCCASSARWCRPRSSPCARWPRRSSSGSPSSGTSGARPPSPCIERPYLGGRSVLAPNICAALRATLLVRELAERAFQSMRQLMHRTALLDGPGARPITRPPGRRAAAREATRVRAGGGWAAGRRRRRACARCWPRALRRWSSRAACASAATCATAPRSRSCASAPALCASRCSTARPTLTRSQPLCMALVLVSR